MDKPGSGDTVTLRDEIRRLAKEVAMDPDKFLFIADRADTIESAILAGVKLVLERKINYNMLQAMDVAYLENGCGSADGIDDSVLVAIYRAMTRELLKELD